MKTREDIIKAAKERANEKQAALEKEVQAMLEEVQRLKNETPWPPEREWPWYVYVRSGGWYPIAAPNDAVAKHMALINPGTIRVIRMAEDYEVWPNN